MLSTLFLVTPGVINYCRSNREKERLNYLEKTQELDPKKDAPSYGVFRSNDFTNYLYFGNETLLTKRTTTMELLRKSTVTMSGFSSGVFSREIRSQLELAKSSNTSFSLDSVLSKLHSKYSKELGTITNNNDNSGGFGLSLGFKNGTISGGSALISEGFKDVVRGVIADESSYLVVGDFQRDRFLNNSNLDVHKDLTIEQVIVNQKESYETTKFYSNVFLTVGFVAVAGELASYYFKW
jgi:hypothetical protein